MKYLWLTLKHKWFVFRAGLKTNAPLYNLIVHDWTKLTPAELPHYQRQFFGDKSDPEGFARAWIHHQNANPHHWEYWIPRTKHTRGTERDTSPAIPMPLRFVREMVADWMGAGRAYTGSWDNIHEWLPKEAPKMVLHPKTIDRLKIVLWELGIDVPECWRAMP